MREVLYDAGFMSFLLVYFLIRKNVLYSNILHNTYKALSLDESTDILYFFVPLSRFFYWRIVDEQRIQRIGRFAAELWWSPPPDVVAVP